MPLLFSCHIENPSFDGFHADASALALEKHGNALFVWHVSESDDELFEAAALDGKEKERYLSASSQSRRREIIAINAIVKTLLSSEITHDENGRPVLANDIRHISLSHTGDYVALAVGLNMLGVDMEHNDRDIRRFAERVFSHDETTLTDNLISLWCAKESLYKAAGFKGVDFRKEIVIESVNGDNMTGLIRDRRFLMKTLVCPTLTIVCTL